MAEEGVRNKPQQLNIKDMRYNILGGHVKADRYLLRDGRRLKGIDLDDDKLMKLEIIRNKLKHVQKYKTDDMLINKTKLRKLIHRYGFYVSKDLADGLNTIILRIVEEAIGRVYNLPGRMERVTIRPSDLPLILQ